MMADMAADMGGWKRASGGSITEVAAGWLAPRYLQSVRGQFWGGWGRRDHAPRRCVNRPAGTPASRAMESYPG